MLSSIPVGAARRDPVAAGAWLWLCGALAIGCAESAPAAPARGARVATPAPAPPVASTAPPAGSAPAGTPRASPPVEHERPGEASPLERWVGTLELTKGAQPLIGGRIMSREDAERWLGPDWRSLTGRRVRVTAVLRDHVCEPHAQCLMGGRIPLLDQVASVEVCGGAETAGRTDVVDCAPSPAQVERCEAECGSLSDGCDRHAGDRGALRRCGCAKISCERGCEETGEPLFACR